jgi:hypothetical protein
MNRGCFADLQFDRLLQSCLAAQPRFQHKVSFGFSLADAFVVRSLDEARSGSGVAADSFRSAARNRAKIS